MPTYEYACKACGQHLEIVQSFKDSALTECPACAGPLRKVFGNIGIAFKGTGFYKTDSRSESKSGRKTAEAKSAGTSTGAAASATVAPAATAESAGKPAVSAPSGSVAAAS
jgi:putative FmdB family regulatory protein